MILSDLFTGTQKSLFLRLPCRRGIQSQKGIRLFFETIFFKQHAPRGHLSESNSRVGFPAVRQSGMRQILWSFLLNRDNVNCSLPLGWSSTEQSECPSLLRLPGLRHPTPPSSWSQAHSFAIPQRPCPIQRTPTQDSEKVLRHS